MVSLGIRLEMVSLGIRLEMVSLGVRLEMVSLGIRLEMVSLGIRLEMVSLGIRLDLLQEQRLHSLRQQEVQRSEQEHLLQLRANAQTQEAKLKTVRAVRTRVEQKRLSNSKLGQTILHIYTSYMYYILYILT